MKVLLSGSTGLVGSALLKEFSSNGDQVDILVRRPALNGHDIQWDPETQELREESLEGYDAVVHLAGESIADGRWTQKKMSRIRDSRVEGTGLLCRALAKVKHKPQVFVCASAIGYYGDQGENVLTESSAVGTGFLAEVCQAWEDASEPAREAGIRVVNMRIGMVLSAQGGALAKMLIPFQLGFGGKIGSGKQWMSWIELSDLLGSIRHAIQDETIEGQVNAVSPQPVTNNEYTKTLGKVISRPTILPLPAFGARLALGKMADELLLASMRVEPQVLLGSGFKFKHPKLEGALRIALER
ncbi:MAG: hypothetical protein ACI9F9_002167 [Candidatus Paceibacteria bacterium]|jgi:uncharacterized protein (TIGR01777 family)